MASVCPILFGGLVLNIAWRKVLKLQESCFLFSTVKCGITGFFSSLCVEESVPAWHENIYMKCLFFKKSEIQLQYVSCVFL